MFYIFRNILKILKFLHIRKYFEDFKIFTSLETFGQCFAPPKNFLKFDNFEETILLTFLQNKYEYFTPAQRTYLPRVLWTNIFGNYFSLFQLEENTILTKKNVDHGFHSDFFFGKQSYFKICSFKPLFML